MVGIETEDWPEQPPLEGSVHDLFWRTILNDSVELDASESPFYRRANANDYVNLRELWLLFLSPFIGLLVPNLSFSVESHDWLMAKAPATVYHLLVCLWQRRMIVTEQGRIGLAPRDSNPGDEIFILVGSPAPFVLRSLNKNTATENLEETVPSYSVIGNGYVHKVMSGEALKEEPGETCKTIALY